MDQIDKERFLNMAETYDRMVQRLVPHYDFLQNEALKLFSLDSRQQAIVVDLGAGSGLMLEKILSNYEHVKCYWVDSSHDFFAVAQKKLAKYGDRIKFINSSLEDNWEDKIEENTDIILSMSAIHHLESEEKQRLYKRCYEKLNPAGWFINIDEMKTVYDEAYINAMQLWVNYVEEYKNKMPESELEDYEAWKAKFDNWRLRNIENAAVPKRKGDDIHENFLEQIRWLKKIGFINVDLFIKYHLWSVIGGQK